MGVAHQAWSFHADWVRDCAADINSAQSRNLRHAVTLSASELAAKHCLSGCRAAALRRQSDRVWLDDPAQYLRSELPHDRCRRFFDPRPGLLSRLVGCLLRAAPAISADLLLAGSPALPLPFGQGASQKAADRTSGRRRG